MCSECRSLCFELLPSCCVLWKTCLNCTHILFFFLLSDRETDGAGATGVAQHAQEAGVLPAGSAGRGHGEETCKEPEELLLSRTLNSLLLLLRNALIRRRRPERENIQPWHLASVALTNEHAQLELSCTNRHQLNCCHTHTTIALTLFSYLHSFLLFLDPNSLNIPDTFSF